MNPTTPTPQADVAPAPERPAVELTADQLRGCELLADYRQTFPPPREKVPSPPWEHHDNVPGIIPAEQRPSYSPTLQIPSKVARNWLPLTAAGRAEIELGKPATLREVQALRAEVNELRAAVFELASVIGTLAGGPAA